MNKLIYNTDFPQMMDVRGPLSQLVETQGHRKTAGTTKKSREYLEEFTPPAGKFLVHTVGIGAHERYGFNRNVDTFDRQTLQDHHHTFEKYAHYFREHNHHHPGLSIGSVKKAFYNPDYDWVELFMWGDREKAASEYEALKNGDVITHSMSCDVDHDVCNCCDNKARSRAEYCSHIKHHPGQYDEATRKYAFVFNPKPLFKDMSSVGRPADRLAYTLGFLDSGTSFAKAASSGALEIPDGFFTKLSVDQASAHGHNHDRLSLPLGKIDILSKLASAERQVASGQLSAVEDHFVKMGHTLCQHESSLSDQDIDKLRTVRPGKLFYEMAKSACAFPFPDFCRYMSGCTGTTADDRVIDAARELFLPTIFSSMEDEGSPVFDEHQLFDPVNDCDYDWDGGVQKLLDEMAEQYSCLPEKAGEKVITIIISNGSLKDGPVTKSSREYDRKTLEQAEYLAHCYGLYKLASVEAIQNNSHEGKKLVDLPFRFLILPN